MLPIRSKRSHAARACVSIEQQRKRNDSQSHTTMTRIMIIIIIINIFCFIIMWSDVTWRHRARNHAAPRRAISSCYSAPHQSTIALKQHLDILSTSFLKQIKVPSL